MYLRQPERIPDAELRTLLRVAEVCIPPSKSSFMVDFDLVPVVLSRREVVRKQLVGLLPSQQIVGHVDASIAPAVRYHVPLQTNQGCWSLHDGVWTQLEVGWMYEMDPTQWHGAVNWGSAVRLHLMIDVLAS